MEINSIRLLFSADSASSIKGKRDAQPLDDDEQTKAEVRKLKEVDSKVRAHEAAHLAAAGGLAHGVSYGYKKGPDGKLYAVSGEVQIDTSPVRGNPQATAAKMQRVRAAALAPADPSAQDMKVARQAAKAEQDALQDGRTQDKKTESPSPKPEGKNAVQCYSSSSSASPKNQIDTFM